MVNKLKINLALLLYLLPNLAFIGQVKYTELRLNSNKVDVTDSIINLNRPCFIFFCPTSKKDSAKISSDVQRFINNRNIKKINDVIFYFIYFFPDKKAAVNGIEIKTKPLKETIYVNDFDCFGINLDKNNIERAIKKHVRSVYATYPDSTFQLIKINTVDSTRCFSFDTERIPFIADFVSEVVNPVYSTDEKISTLNDQFEKLKIDVVELKKQNQFLIQKIDSLNIIFQEKKNKKK